MQLNKNKFVFLDLETAGLGTNDPILEVGVTIYDNVTGTIEDECSWVVRPMVKSLYNPSRFELQDVDKFIAGLDEVVVNMHTKNGLFEELKDTEHTLFHVGKMLPDWLLMNGLDFRKEKFICAGNGIDRFDRPRLRHNAIPLNNVDEVFHYRSLDVSAQFYGFGLAGHELIRPEVESVVQHRSLGDNRQAIADWKLIKEKVARVASADITRGLL